MYAAESARADGIEAVAIVSPRATHFKLAKGALEAGLHVICEKPVTESAEEARELQRLADQKDVIFCLTHGYSGYPMIRHARAMIAEGAIGDVRMLHVEFSLGMGASRDESKATRAPWSFDLSAIPYTWIMLEVGSHAEHLARYVTGLLPVEVCAEINAASPLFPFDDTALLMVRYDNAARGMMWVSVSAAGSTLGSLRLRVYGQLGALEWSHARPEELIYTQVDKPRQTLVRGEPGMSDLANTASRIPQGLPEGFLEAFANIYRDFSEAVRAKKNRNNLSRPGPDRRR
jgi:predicted dehydrogenase